MVHGGDGPHHRHRRVGQRQGFRAALGVALDEQIARLQHARGLLAAALWCRFDHPATDCTIMGAEIDRRLDRSAAR
jgi:hypothetical protein